MNPAVIHLYFDIEMLIWMLTPSLVKELHCKVVRASADASGQTDSLGLFDVSDYVVASAS